MIEKYGLKPRAKILATAIVGSNPIIMLLGVIPATKKVLKKANLTLGRLTSRLQHPIPPCCPHHTENKPYCTFIPGFTVHGFAP